MANWWRCTVASVHPGSASEPCDCHFSRKRFAHLAPHLVSTGVVSEDPWTTRHVSLVRWWRHILRGSVAKLVAIIALLKGLFWPEISVHILQLNRDQEAAKKLCYQHKAHSFAHCQESSHYEIAQTDPNSIPRCLNLTVHVAGILESLFSFAILWPSCQIPIAVPSGIVVLHKTHKVSWHLALGSAYEVHSVGQESTWVHGFIVSCVSKQLPLCCEVLVQKYLLFSAFFFFPCKWVPSLVCKTDIRINWNGRIVIWLFGCCSLHVGQWHWKHCFCIWRLWESSRTLDFVPSGTSKVALTALDHASFFSMHHTKLAQR